MQEVSSSSSLIDLPGEVLVHHIIPFLSDYHPKDVMKLILLNREMKEKIVKGLGSFKIVGSELVNKNAAIYRANFRKPRFTKRDPKSFEPNFSKPKKYTTTKDLIMLDKFKNLTSVTFESLYFDEKNKEKIVSALRNVEELSEIKFIKCKGCFMEILKPFNEKLTSLQFINCTGSVFHKHEVPFPTCTKLVFENRYFDGQHKKYKSKMITDLHLVVPQLTSLTYIDKSSKSFSAATPSFYSLSKLQSLTELHIDAATFTCPKLEEFVKNCQQPSSLKLTLPRRFEKLVLGEQLSSLQINYLKQEEKQQ